MSRIWLLAPLTLVGCVPTPEWYTIPPQHVAPPLTIDSREFVSVTDLGADSYYVKDVQGLEGGFRWTNAEPEFRFYLKSTARRTLRINLAVNEVTFRETGPVTVVVLVNGNELVRTQYDQPGHKKIEQTVPEAWLKKNVENRVIMKVLNPWTGSDGARLGVVLFGAGFLE